MSARRARRRERMWAGRLAALTGVDLAQGAWDAARAAVAQAPAGRRDQAWRWIAEALVEARSQIVGFGATTTDRDRLQIYNPATPTGPTRARDARARHDEV